MFNKLKEFIFSFKVKSTEKAAEAPYKLEPPASNNTATVPINVQANVSLSETTSPPDTIKFPITPETSSVSEFTEKKVASKRKPKAEKVEPKSVVSAPAMKVIKTKTNRKSKKDSIE